MKYELVRDPHEVPVALALAERGARGLDPTIANAQLVL
jgi:hypothetical protein